MSKELIRYYQETFKHDDRAKYFNDFLEYLEDNKTPLGEELKKNVLYLYMHWGLSLTDLLIIVNSKIYPLKLIQVEVPLQYDPIVTPDEVKESLQLVDMREGSTSINHQSDANTARVILINQKVVIRLSNGKDVVIKSLRIDAAPYNFMQYMLSHPNTKIGRATISLSVGGDREKQDMTELARYAGFNRKLKDIFFPGTTAREVYFRPEVTLNALQHQYIGSMKNREKS